MKQHLSPEDWGQFERANTGGAKKFRVWLDAIDYPPSKNGCILYETQPVCVRATIGRLIEFLDEHSDSTYKVTLWSALIKGYDDFFIPTNQWCDSLWEACKEVLEK